MHVSEYAEKIFLYEDWIPVHGSEYLEMFRQDRSFFYNRVLDFLLGENVFGDYSRERTSTPAEQRRLIQALLTLRPPAPFNNDVWKTLDLIFYAEALEREKAGHNINASGLKFKNRVTYWRGDITTIKADAIVNAANSALLGCFEPFHRCIDNAIHSVAGPRLRNDCGIITDMQGKLEPAGSAKLTRAYALPARFVLHTVGPVVPDHKPDRHQEQLLKSCYYSCLDCCAEANAVLGARHKDKIRTVVFCCISTGLFGYPQEDGAKAAYEAVTEWTERNSEDFNIIFNVFGEEDEAIYRGLLGHN